MAQFFQIEGTQQVYMVQRNDNVGLQFATQDPSLVNHTNTAVLQSPQGLLLADAVVSSPNNSTIEVVRYANSQPPALFYHTTQQVVDQQQIEGVNSQGMQQAFQIQQIPHFKPLQGNQVVHNHITNETYEVTVQETDQQVEDGQVLFQGGLTEEEPDEIPESTQSAISSTNEIENESGGTQFIHQNSQVSVQSQQVYNQVVQQQIVETVVSQPCVVQQIPLVQTTIPVQQHLPVTSSVQVSAASNSVLTQSYIIGTQAAPQAVRSVYIQTEKVLQGHQQLQVKPQTQFIQPVEQTQAFQQHKQQSQILQQAKQQTEALQQTKLQSQVLHQAKQQPQVSQLKQQLLVLPGMKQQPQVVQQVKQQSQFVHLKQHPSALHQVKQQQIIQQSSQVKQQVIQQSSQIKQVILQSPQVKQPSQVIQHGNQQTQLTHIANHPTQVVQTIKQQPQVIQPMKQQPQVIQPMKQQLQGTQPVKQSLQLPSTQLPHSVHTVKQQLQGPPAQLPQTVQTVKQQLPIPSTQLPQTVQTVKQQLQLPSTQLLQTVQTVKQSLQVPSTQLPQTVQTVKQQPQAPSTQPPQIVQTVMQQSQVQPVKQQPQVIQQVKLQQTQIGKQQQIEVSKDTSVVHTHQHAGIKITKTQAPFSNLNVQSNSVSNTVPVKRKKTPNITRRNVSAQKVNQVQQREENVQVPAPTSLVALPSTEYIDLPPSKCDELIHQVKAAVVSDDLPQEQQASTIPGRVWSLKGHLLSHCQPNCEVQPQPAQTTVQESPQSSHTPMVQLRLETSSTPSSLTPQVKQFVIQTPQKRVHTYPSAKNRVITKTVTTEFPSPASPLQQSQQQQVQSQTLVIHRDPQTQQQSLMTPRKDQVLLVVPPNRQLVHNNTNIRVTTGNKVMQTISLNDVQRVIRDGAISLKPDVSQGLVLAAGGNVVVLKSDTSIISSDAIKKLTGAEGTLTTEAMKIIPGKLAVCKYCGVSSADFNRCSRCKRKLPLDCKVVDMKDFTNGALTSDKKEAVILEEEERQNIRVVFPNAPPGASLGFRHAAASKSRF